MRTVKAVILKPKCLHCHKESTTVVQHIGTNTWLGFCRYCAYPITLAQTPSGVKVRVAHGV